MIKKQQQTISPNSTQITSSTPVIGFLDVDAFECQLWQREYPTTRSLPCIVANHSGRIVSVTHEAKAYGINRKDTPNVKQAKMKCPNLHIFTKPDKFGKQDQSRCRLGTWQIVKAIQNFLDKKSITDVVIEVASSDEIYLDISAEVSRGMELKGAKLQLQRMSEAPQVLQNKISIPANIVWERECETKRGPFLYWQPHAPNINSIGMMVNGNSYTYKNQERLMFGGLFMDELCSHVENETKLQSSGGVAKNKLLAKIGCSLNKPGKITVLGDEAFKKVAKMVSISSIPGLGGSNGQQLMEKFGIETISDIFGIQSQFDQLEAEFGNQMAQKIFSSAKGLDVDPVVAKIHKDQIRMSKPSGDIQTLPKLELIVHNLIKEVGIVLEEEESRYFRTTDTIRVEFNLVGDEKGFGQDFGISAKNIFKDIIKFIAPNQKSKLEKDAVVTRLAFVLKNFQPWSGVIGAKLEAKLNISMQSLSVGIPNTLKVNTKCPPTAANLKFRHIPVGLFQITQDLKLSNQSATLPAVISSDALQSLVGYKLLRSFKKCDPPTVITDYNHYDQIKHRCFSNWLKSEGHKVTDGFKSIHFISFHGRIYRALKTLWNQNFGEYDTYGMNVNGIIYLWDEKTPKPRAHSFNYSKQFMGCLFENLTTGKGQSGIPEDDIEKVFVVQKVEFGSHKLLLLNNVDGEDSSGNYVQTTLGADPAEFKNNDMSIVLERKLKLWAQAIVSGAGKLVIGTKNMKNILTRVEVHETDEFRSTIMTKEEMMKCFNFEDRFLTFIKSHLQEDDVNLVKKFSWCPGKHNVAVSIIPKEEVGNLLVPKIYL